MDSLLEEGELLDSDPEDEKVKVANEALVQQCSAAAISSHTTAAGVASWAVRQRRCPGLSSSEDDIDDNDGSADTDSDGEYHRPSEKRSRAFAPSKSTEDVPFHNPLLANPHKSSSHPGSNTWNRPGARPQQSKNSVWSCVLQEQTLTRTIDTFGVENKEYLKNSDRDVESYDYTKSLLDPRHVKPVYGDDMFEDDTEDKEDEAEPQLADVESFGLDAKPKPASAKLRLGKRTDKTEKREKRGSVDSELGERPSAFNRLGSAEHSGVEAKDMDAADASVTESFTAATAAEQGGSLRSVQERLGTREQSGRKRKHKPSASQRLGERSFDKSKSRHHIKVTDEDPPDKVAGELMDILQEPDYMEELWKRIPETLGNKLTLELLYMTEDLEEVGGLWINNGNRRRTPGGVYLFLLKEAKNITDEQKKHIFSWDKNEKYKAKKAVKKRAIRRKKERTQDWVDEAKSEMRGDDYLGHLKQYAESKKRQAKKEACGDTCSKKEQPAEEMKEESVVDKEGGVEDVGMEDDQDNLDISGEGDIVLELD